MMRMRNGFEVGNGGWLLLLMLGLLLGWVSLSRADELPPPPPNTKVTPPSLPAPVQIGLGGLQIPFVENRGQMDNEVAFSAQTLTRLQNADAGQLETWAERIFEVDNLAELLGPEAGG